MNSFDGNGCLRSLKFGYFTTYINLLTLQHFNANRNEDASRSYVSHCSKHNTSKFPFKRTTQNMNSLFCVFRYNIPLFVLSNFIYQLKDVSAFFVPHKTGLALYRWLHTFFFASTYITHAAYLYIFGK